MCFRPAEADTAKPIKCPKCGKKIRPTNGVFPSKCPFCKFEADFENLDEDELAAASAPIAAPKAPEPAKPAAAAPAASGAPAVTYLTAPEPPADVFVVPTPIGPPPPPPPAPPKKAAPAEALQRRERPQVHDVPSGGRDLCPDQPEKSG